MNLPRTRWLVASMALTVALIAALAFWDQLREAAIALDEFGQEQAVLASSIAAGLTGRLDEIRHDAMVLAGAGASSPPAILHSYLSVRRRLLSEPPAPLPGGSPAVLLSVPVGGGEVVDLVTPTANLLAPMSRLEVPNERAVLLLPPGARRFETWDGRQVVAEEMRVPLETGFGTVRLTQQQAARLGLPARVAMAGLARVNDPLLGRWGVAVITSASRDRDRDRRADLRLLLSISLAATLVVVFGGLALRERARELEMARSLALEQLGREREGQLERENRAATVITLASGVAHEIATPLGVIVGRAEQLQARLGVGGGPLADERAGKAVQAILDQTQRIRDVIAGFLSLARGVPPALASLPPAEVLAAAVELVQHRFSKAGVQLVGSAGSNLPLIRCDSRLLEHALVNLLINACDACRRGGHVELHAEELPSAVAFVVSDDGEGIPDAVAARATEPFFTTKPPGRGTGLGLAIANEIVKTHRGSLTIARGELKGTRVCVQIPLAKEGVANG